MRSKAVLVLVSVLTTVIITLITTNLSSQQNPIDYQFKGVDAIDTADFRRSMENMMGPTFTLGNQITAFQNGDEIFPPMLAAIRAAKKNINFESYIYVGGRIGQEFVDALCERARAGVAVHLLIDWVGSQHVDQLIEQLEAAGVNVKKYHPLRWYAITRMNNRTHRKLLIVDGTVGFTGGVGISDDWLGHAQDPDHWRDSHYRVHGPAVGQLQAAFTDNWLSTSSEVLQGNDYFPKLAAAGPSIAEVFKSAPREGADSSELMYMMSIYAARHEILIANSYFVPSPLSMKALLAARTRGVKIRIITPGPHMDSETVRFASHSHWGELLQAGIEIAEYQPTMYHCKFMIVDREWTTVGSTNFDIRSFKLNSESNLNIEDSKFALEQVAVFDNDWKNSKQYSFEEWRDRSWKERAGEALASLVEKQL